MINPSLNKNKPFDACGLIIGLALAVIFVRHDATAAQGFVPLESAATFGVLVQLSGFGQVIYLRA